MMEEDFYATLKLKTGEEIFAKVIPTTEESEEVKLLITGPIIITELNSRTGSKVGYKVEPWLKTTKEDMFVINMNDILTMSESRDMEMIMVYQSFIKKHNSHNVLSHQEPNKTRKMGYLSNVNEAKRILENIYKNL
nr:hypothetical protein [uncultured Mediterranean phage uvMED]|tara:strand:+ start:41 stop:448 length:408 start_codon:yes stop_codon:yes gene_type:complete